MTVDEGRRRTLKGLVLGAAALPLGGAIGCTSGTDPDHSTVPGPPPSAESARSDPVVYRARREGFFPTRGGPPDPRKIADALGAAVSRAAGEANAVDGFRRLFRPEDVVGIKVNALAGPGLSARPVVVGQVTTWLQAAGVPARQIVVLERSDRELERIGFRPNRSGGGVRVIGTGRDFERRARDWGPNSSRFARILVEEMTALVNVGVLKDGGDAGVAIGMKDWYGVINNPATCHDDGCHPFIAHLAASPPVRERLRLTIIDALTAQCHAGPYYNPRWSWSYGGFLVSRDPVALDAVGAQILEERRKEVSLPTLAEEGRHPKWIAEGARIGLGEADLAKISLVDV